MTICKTFEKAQKFAKKRCFHPIIKPIYSKKHGTIKGYEVIDEYDLRNKKGGINEA